MSNPKICQPAVPASFFKSGWRNRHTCRQARQHGEFATYRRAAKHAPLGNKPNKYHRVRNQYEGENHSEIGNIAGQAKAGSIAFADLTIQTPANGRRGRTLRPWRSQYHPIHRLVGQFGLRSRLGARTFSHGRPKDSDHRCHQRRDWRRRAARMSPPDEMRNIGLLALQRNPTNRCSKYPAHLCEWV